MVATSLPWCAAGVLTALVVSAAVVLLSVLIGVSIGLVSGYSRPAVDNSLMRFTDLQLAVPPLVLFIAASAVVSGSVVSVIILLSIVSWVPYARLVRARVLVERERGYISAARLAGTRTWRILLVHLLPAATTDFGPRLAPGGAPSSIESGLSFLGLGAAASAHQPWLHGLGRTRGSAGSVVGHHVPGCHIVLLVLAFNLIGDGLRDLIRSDVELGR